MELVKTFSGYHIRKKEGKRYLYIKSMHNNGIVDYTSDYTYARTFTRNTAKSIVNYLKLQTEV